MIQGLGNDIIEVNRIEKMMSDHDSHFLDRIFTKEEQSYCLRHRDASRHFAGRFAAKEAIVKALGTGFRGGISWLDFEILNDIQGKPIVTFSTKINHQFNEPKILLSISHCREYATAVAIWLSD